MNTEKKINAYIIDMIFLAAIAAFAFWVNRDIVIKGLYMDDLYMWSCYGEQSLTEFVFPIGTSTRFRPVYWFATYLQMMIVGNHITRFVTFNVIVNVITAYLLYYIARRLSKSRICALITGLCYLASRFAYYQIGQALGLMETMALFLAIAMLWQLYRYMEEAKGYWSALIIYFLLVFTHERYLSLFPLIYLVLVIRRLRENKASKEGCDTFAGKCIVPLVELIIIIGIRCFAIGKAIPAGTGGTEVTETFGIKQAIGFCFDQVRYIFGINAGPEYLNGLTWEDTPSYIRKLVYIGIVLICAVVCIYVFDLMRKHSRSALRRALETALLFGGFIALCIGCSSVTIRLEMRWIYVSFAASLLYASYMTGSLSQEQAQEQAQSHIQECERIITIDEERCESQGVSPARSRGCGEQGGCHGGTKGTIKPLAVTLFTAYALVTIYVNIFYRGYFTRIYLWPNQLRMNSLAEQTVEKYGIDGILGKDIYILGNSYEMSEFYADTFFKTFDPKMKAEGTEVIFIDSIEDADFEGIENGEALVLKELPEDNAYLDITKEVLSHFQSEPSGNAD